MRTHRQTIQNQIGLRRSVLERYACMCIFVHCTQQTRPSFRHSTKAAAPGETSYYCNATTAALCFVRTVMNILRHSRRLIKSKVHTQHRSVCACVRRVRLETAAAATDDDAYTGSIAVKDANCLYYGSGNIRHQYVRHVRRRACVINYHL